MRRTWAPWDERGWNRLKNMEMGHLVCKDLEELHEEFHLSGATSVS